MKKIKDDDIKDDFMIIENYDNSDNSLDLKITLEHIVMIFNQLILIAWA